MKLPPGEADFQLVRVTAGVGGNKRPHALIAVLVASRGRASDQEHRFPVPREVGKTIKTKVSYLAIFLTPYLSVIGRGPG